MIIGAAQRVVGREGYAGATISRIAEEAGVSLGGLYHYFGSQQEVFDLLLPSLGTEFFEFRNDRTRGAKTYIEFEQADFWALRLFIQQRPEFIRIFFEAPHFAPNAYEDYIRVGRARYLTRLTLAWQNGEMQSYEQDELPRIAEMILSAKIYLFRMYTRLEQPWLPEQMIDTYIRFLRCGVV